MPYKSPHNHDEGDIHTGTRVCTSCQTRKPMEEFHWSKRDLYRVRKCKACTHEQQRLRPRDRERQFERHLRVAYGLTPAGYQSLWDSQNGCCAICGRPMTEEGVKDKRHIDHDHRTGRVRGLLCFQCNTGLGKFQDSVEFLRMAIDYLERVPPLVETRPKELSPSERTANRRAAALKVHRSEGGQRRLRERSERDRGSNGYNAKLAEADVIEIRRLAAGGGLSQAKIAERFGVEQTTVSAIVRRKTWAHLDA